MITALFAALLAAVQPTLHGAAPTGQVQNPKVRRAILPGKPEPRLQPIDGFSCRAFVGYSDDQLSFNLQTGDATCSGQIPPDGSGGFRQLNFLPSRAGPLPVVIYSPRRQIDAASRIVIYLNGGPRALVTNRPLATQLVAQGYTVLMPIYLGEIETLHPAADLPGAVEQIDALNRWAGDRLVATIGISTGAYLAAAACTADCAPRILLAPPITAPEEGLADSSVDWAKLTEGSCLWRRSGQDQVCDDLRSLLRSFWGPAYYRTRLAGLLRGRCGNVRVVVSVDDKRVYSAKEVANLRRTGCPVETPGGFGHFEVDSNPAANARTLALLADLTR